MQQAGSNIPVCAVPLPTAPTAYCKQSVTCRVQVLAEAETEELNFIVLNINCSALAEVVSRPTMDMLTGSDQRLPELHVLARSNLHAVCTSVHAYNHDVVTVLCSSCCPTSPQQILRKNCNGST